MKVSTGTRAPILARSTNVPGWGRIAISGGLPASMRVTRTVTSSREVSKAIPMPVSAVKGSTAAEKDSNSVPPHTPSTVTAPPETGFSTTTVSFTIFSTTTVSFTIWGAQDTTSVKIRASKTTFVIHLRVFISFLLRFLGFAHRTSDTHHSVESALLSANCASDSARITSFQRISVLGAGAHPSPTRLSHDEFGMQEYLSLINAIAVDQANKQISSTPALLVGR